MDTVYLPPEECEELRGKGYPQGKTPYLWHKDKQRHDEWVLWKRNPHDMSQDADKMGFNRWVSAVTPEQAKNWRDRRKPPKMSPVLMPARNVNWKTFRFNRFSNPRKAAALFATSCRDDLISITESWAHIYLHVTVYFWKG